MIRRTTAAVGSKEKTTAPAMIAFWLSRSIGNTYTMAGTAYPELTGQRWVSVNRETGQPSWQLCRGWVNMSFQVGSGGIAWASFIMQSKGSIGRSHCTGSGA